MTDLLAALSILVAVLIVVAIVRRSAERQAQDEFMPLIDALAAIEDKRRRHVQRAVEPDGVKR